MTSPTHQVPGEAPDGRAFGVGKLAIALETLGVSVIACALAAVLYRLWDAPLHRPATYLDGDMNQTETTVRTIIQSGWIFNQPRLGAPFGQVNYDFPQGGESLQYLLIKLLSLFTSSSGLIVNLYFFAGFGLVAAVVHLVLRHLRFAPLVSAALALPYAFLPFRLFHNEAHLSRTTYLSVPLACLLLVWLPAWRQRFLREPSLGPPAGWRHNLRWPRVAAALACCLMVGMWETMATAFALVLIFTASVVGAIRWHEWRRLVVGAIGCIGIGLGFVLLSLPSLWYWHVHGKNPDAGKRIVAEAELYGLKINRLILPSDGSRLHVMQIIATKSQARTPVISEGGQSIGVLFTLGLVGALYAAVAGVRQLRSAGEFDLRAADDREALREVLGLTTVSAILLATVGGFSTVLALAGFGQVRTWNRISLFIAFFALLQVAIWIERGTRWAGGRLRWSPPLVAVATVVVCALALADGPPVQHPDYPSVVAQSRNDHAIVDQIENLMPAGSAIIEVPPVVYPEAYPPGRMRDYDPLRPYLADEKGRLRWSYGRVRGRPEADWQRKLATGDQVLADLPALLGMGFTGLWVDSYGYIKTPAIPGRIRQALHEQPITSPDGRFQFFDLRPLRASLGQSDSQLKLLATTTFGIAPPD